MQIELSVGLEGQAQRVARRGDVDGGDQVGVGAAADQPRAVAFEQGDVLRGPGIGRLGARVIGRQPIVAGVAAAPRRSGRQPAAAAPQTASAPRAAAPDERGVRGGAHCQPSRSWLAA